MMAQTPILTLHIILIFQRNTIGRIERIKSVAAAMAINHGISLPKMPVRQMMTLTSLRYSQGIDGGVRPAMSFNRLIPIQCNRCTLREDNSRVNQTGQGVEHDKGPEENLPSLASRTVATRTVLLDMYPVSALARTYNSRFRNKLIEIFTKTVEIININSAIRMSMIL